MGLESPIQRDGDRGFLRFSSRVNPLTLEAGTLQMAENVRLDRGVAQVRKGAKRLATGISLANSPLVLDFALSADKSVTSITRSSSTATVTLTAHGYSTGDKVNIRGAVQSEYNGDFTITKIDNNSFSYTVIGSPATPATGTIVANNGPIVRNVYSGGIFGSGVYASKAYDNASEYIVLLGPDRAFLWSESASATTSSGLPEVAYPSSPVPETIEATDTVSVVQAFDRLYVLREADVTVSGWGKKSITSGGITVSSTTATVNLTAHGYSAGDRVRLEGSTTPALDGHEYDIATASTNSFTITVPSGTASDTTTSGRTARKVKPPLYWDGSAAAFVRSSAGVPSGLGATYKTMRSAGWAAFIANRLILPDGRDQLLISDYLDADTYDPFWQSFRVGAGGNDHIVAVHPWVDNSALVFCRKSIWLATLSQTSSTDGTDVSINYPLSSLELVTDEIGCSARKTIATAGNYVFFLSDAGVYRLDTKLDLKLRGDTKPLSDPIADLFYGVSDTRVKNAYGIWHDNRYMIALPTTPYDSDGNDLVVCWNALNDGWEYKDTYSIGVDELLVSSYSNERRTFNVRSSGGLYLLDEKESGMDDTAVSGTEHVVSGMIKTRRYDYGDMHSKRFVRSIAEVVIPSGATVTAKLTAINPDVDATVIGSITNATGAQEDYNMKSPVRIKAHSAEMIYEMTNGRSEIRGAAVEAAMKSLPSQETRDAA